LERSELLLESFLLQKILHCSVSGNVPFVLRSVEEGEGEDGDGSYTLDVQESIC